MARKGLLIRLTEEEERGVRRSAEGAGLPVAVWARQRLTTGMVADAGLPIIKTKAEAERAVTAVTKPDRPMGTGGGVVPGMRCDRHKRLLPCWQCGAGA